MSTIWFVISLPGRMVFSFSVAPSRVRIRAPPCVISRPSSVSASSLPAAVAAIRRNSSGLFFARLTRLLIRRLGTANFLSAVPYFSTTPSNRVSPVGRSPSSISAICLTVSRILSAVISDLNCSLASSSVTSGSGVAASSSSLASSTWPSSVSARRSVASPAAVYPPVS